MKKMLFVIFSENMNYGVSTLANLALENNWDPNILFVPNDAETNFVANYLADFPADMVGFSFTTYKRNLAFKVAAPLRKLHLTTVAGGIHPTVATQDVLNSGLFDIVVKGDGMGVLSDILNRQGQQKTIVINGRPLAQREAYTKRYFSPSQLETIQERGVFPLLSSIGCPFKCHYCFNGASAFFHLPLDAIISEINQVCRHNDITTLSIYDEVFATNADKIASFHKELTHSGHINFNFENIQCHASLFNDRIAEEMCRMGIKTANMGIETLSPKLLSFLNKKQTPEDIYQAAEICRKFGLRFMPNILLGIPTQDREDYELTYEFIQKVKPESLTVYYFTPYPGSYLFDYCFDHGFMQPTWDRQNFDWFVQSNEGHRSLAFTLKGVDYELMNEYDTKIRQWQLSNCGRELLLKKMELIDKLPWAIIGNSLSSFFSDILKYLSMKLWNNCCGFIDLYPDGRFGLADSDSHRFSLYDSAKSNTPQWFVTTYSPVEGSDWHRHYKPYIQNKFGAQTSLISISTFSNNPHDLDYISNIYNELIKRPSST